MINILKEEWHYKTHSNNTSVIVPDGCRDIVIRKDNTGRICVEHTPLAVSAYSVTLKKSTELFGFRLAPGTLVNEPLLTSFVNCMNNNLDFSDHLEEFCSLNLSVSEALDGLNSGFQDISVIAKGLGVSVRTLQRYVKNNTGESPQFWISLVRARRCGRMLSKAVSLADCAIESHYSDQAHMTREIKRWFGCTPLSIQSGLLKSELLLSGYD